jgi:DNA modification methylase
MAKTKKIETGSTKRLSQAQENQDEMFEKSVEQELEESRTTKKVECLGITFDNDEERRKYFTEKLKDKLNDPEFRKIEGFPIGSDEDILALSDPPYYTACPNPFLDKFIDLNINTSNDHRVGIEPYSSDISEGKEDPIYNVHAYPTKVPPNAIVPLIKHYTQENDLILDPFSGTGMTSVASQRLPNRNYVLQDLSPAATHISSILNSNHDLRAFKRIATTILKAIEDKNGWMYQTKIRNKKESIRYFVWSDVYFCDSCGKNIRIWDIEGTESVGGLKNEKPCSHCGALISKQKMQPVIESYYDPILGDSINRIKCEPVLKVIVKKNRSQKLHVSENDLLVLKHINDLSITFVPITKKMLFKDGEWGDQWRSSYHKGVTHSHHFYTTRNYWILSDIWQEINEYQTYECFRLLRFWFTSSLSRLTRLNRYMAQHNRHVGPLAGTLFIGPIQAEISPFYFFSNKLNDIISTFQGHHKNNTGQGIVSTSSSTKLNVPDCCVDYIFTDPPFGDNLMYSELNFLTETWLGVFTNQKQEAVIAKSQTKSLHEFKILVEGAFSESYRVLKPGRWITVEFHNSRNSVWVAIQEALMASGFVIADVRVLDKEKGTTKQLTQSGTVKQDLIITAYKPNDGLEDRFRLEAGTEEGVWDFVRTHLKQLPVLVEKNNKVEIIAERQKFLLYDRMLAFHVQRGVSVPISATDFYNGLTSRFSERDRMFFLSEQVVRYDKAKAKSISIDQLELFIKDESSAIEWLQFHLQTKPQSFQVIHPQFMKEIAGWEKHEKSLELLELLEQNFLCYDGEGDVPNQIHAYLSSDFKELRKLEKDNPSLRGKAKDRWYIPDPNKAGDLEKIRDKALLKEFWEYLPSGYIPPKPEIFSGQLSLLEDRKKRDIPTGKRLKIIRLEAVRAGFKHCWQNKDYHTIIAVGNRIEENILQEDPKLLMWYDQAQTRLGENT